MLRARSLQIPTVLPHADAIRSAGSNEHDYEPEFWEFQYEGYRYLGRVSQGALVERYQALMRNMKALVSADRHVIPVQNVLSSWYWYRKEHQTRLEFSMRGADLPVAPPAGILDYVPFDAPVRPRSPNAGDVLFRYGKRIHMEDMVRHGTIRIAPAAHYRSLELGIARADEELSKSLFWPGQYTKLTNREGKLMPAIGDARWSVSGPDYYMLCLSCDWDRTLFEAFAADACVVIRRPDVFAQRLKIAAEIQLAGWYFHHNPVWYLDPYETRKQEGLSASMCKDFRFAYQREYRFLWLNLGGCAASGFIYLDLGPLDGVAELHLL
jgi:hypothetical protein